jgi:hypothetical protein
LIEPALDAALAFVEAMANLGVLSKSLPGREEGGVATSSNTGESSRDAEFCKKDPRKSGTALLD